MVGYSYRLLFICFLYSDPECTACIIDFYQNKNFPDRNLTQAGRNKSSEVLESTPETIMPEAWHAQPPLEQKPLWNQLTHTMKWKPDSEWSHILQWQFTTCAINLWYFSFLSIFLMCEKTLFGTHKKIECMNG